MGWIISFHLFKSKKKYKKCENSPESNKNPKKMSTSSNSFLITVIGNFSIIQSQNDQLLFQHSSS